MKKTSWVGWICLAVVSIGLFFVVWHVIEPNNEVITKISSITSITNNLALITLFVLPAFEMSKEVKRVGWACLAVIVFTLVIAIWHICDPNHEIIASIKNVTDTVSYIALIIFYLMLICDLYKKAKSRKQEG